MKRPLLILLAMVFGLIAIAAIMMVIMVSHARAQPPTILMYNMMALPCVDTKELEADLARSHKEVAIGAAVDSENDLIRLFSSGKSFTLVMTKPTGMSCFLATGENWEVSPNVQGSKT